MTAIYPGSFDPVTLGHLDMLKRGAQLTNQLIVAVCVNNKKQPLFTLSERVSLLREATAGMASVMVEAYTGLLATYVKERNAAFILRGVRSSVDFTYESSMACINRRLTGGIDTLLLPAEPGLSHISGSAVREIAAILYRDGGDDAVLDEMVPPAVKESLRKALGNAGRL